MKISTRLMLPALALAALLAASCGFRKKVDVMQTYSYRDTLYSLQPLHQDTALQFPAPEAWPVDTVLLDTTRYFDSLVKRPLLVFNTIMQVPVTTRSKEAALPMNDTILSLAMTSNRITSDWMWPKVFESHVTPDTLMGRLYGKLETIMLQYMKPPRNGQNYYFGMSGNFSYFSDKVLTYRLHGSQYTLGAHGNHGTQYIVFDCKTGKPLREQDVFVLSEKNRKEVAALLRESYAKFLAKDTVDRQGMKWNASSLTMNGNFAVVDDGIVYHYDPCEAGPYALGSLELKLLSFQLQPYLREGTPVYKLWFK